MITSLLTLNSAVRVGGFALFGLVIVSPLIPRILNWREDTAKLEPLTRKVFWTYACYTWAINLWFALITVCLSTQLLNKTPLAAAVSAFIAIYWLGRLAVQFFYFGPTHERSLIERLGEVALVSLFAYLSITFFAATLHNCGMLL